MEAKNTQVVSASVLPKVKTDTETALGKFIHSQLPGNVTEEELFAGVLQERLQTLTDDESLKRFQRYFAKEENRLKDKHGYVPVKEAAVDALIDIQLRGQISLDQAQTIFSQALEASGVDSPDGMTKHSVALYSKKRAISMASQYLSNVDAQRSPAPKQISIKDDAVDTSSTDLYYKAVSRQRTFAALLPEKYANKAASVVLKDSDGKTIDTGRSLGYGAAGVREKFVFSKSGLELPKNLTVEVTLNSGKRVRFQVDDPAKSYES